MGYQKLHHLKGVCTRCCGVAGFRVSVGYMSLSASCVLYLIWLQEGNRLPGTFCALVL